MSTYSWSYKTASHRQVSGKQAETQQEDSCQKAEVVSKALSLPNVEAGTGVSKRLNWRAKIYVGNLNKKTNEASLAYYFSVFGDIEDIKLIRDHDTKESRGFAFITFEKIESAENAKRWCSFNYPTLDDNSITVASAERKTHKIKNATNEQKAKRDPSQTLFWEFKWESTNDAQVYGPYETSLMLAWKNQGYFDRGCWIRQVLHRQTRRTEDRHDVKIDISEGNVEEKTSDFGHKCNVESETYEASPCKKSKLAIDYSDSEEEDSNETSDKAVGNEEGIRRSILGQNEYNKGTEEISIVVQHEGKKILNEEVEDEEVPTGERCEIDDSRGSRNKEVVSEELKNTVIEDVEGCRRTLSDDTEGTRGMEGDDTKQSKRTVMDDKEEYEGAMVDNIKGCKGTVMDERKIDEERNGKQEEDNLVQKEDEHSTQPLRDEKPEEKKDILQMYEERATVFSDSEVEHGEEKMNDEDLFDETSSEDDEEDVDDNPDEISTEFVSISEIDFNLYP
ncbi:HIV Tat-specific factor 1 homolog [Dendronephthya gigantea]|uniref:HIV Tat-specific factor 1 homolog n=1 Tax=Dendronephthya gigantea TaxID=151771 RepID=UPI00106D8DAC|nr:HIV Tat-specific factor 1 homolog [Dendronephthya gigantea]